MKRLATAVLAAGTALAAAPAFALPATAAFDFDISGDANVPTMTLTNTSSAGVELTSFRFFIGDSGYNIDEVYTISAPGMTAVLTEGDAAQGGARPDAFTIAFTGFEPGESASWDVDVDVDSANTVEDYRTVFFNNGDGSGNATLAAAFSTGNVLNFTLPDFDPAPASYSFAVSSSPVPLPAALPLLGAGLAALGVAARRRV